MTNNFYFHFRSSFTRLTVWQLC